MAGTSPDWQPVNNAWGNPSDNIDSYTFTEASINAKNIKSKNATNKNLLPPGWEIAKNGFIFDEKGNHQGKLDEDGQMQLKETK